MAGSIPPRVTRQEGYYMRIIFTGRWLTYPFSLVGAARSTHALIMKMIKCGHEVKVIYPEDINIGTRIPADFESDIKRINSADRIIHCPYPTILTKKYLAHKVFEEIQKEKPDVICSNTSDIMEIGNLCNIPVIIYVRSPDDLKIKDIEYCFQHGCHIISNYYPVKEYIEKNSSVVVETVIPSVIEKEYMVPYNINGKITMIGTVPQKGIHIFWKIVDKLKSKKFILAESWLNEIRTVHAIEQAKQRPNVEFSRKVIDVKRLYERTALLIVPSQWEEAGSRAIIEAHQSGIPVIASNTGGSAFMVGEGGIIIKNKSDVDEWAEAISTMDFKEYHPKALANSQRKEFDPDYNVNRFVDYCQSLTVKKSFKKREPLRVKFYVSDRCSFRCDKCHWFSASVTTCDPPDPETYIQFLKTNSHIHEVSFTGGEPTLWKKLPLLINKLPVSVKRIIVYTNASNISLLEIVNRKIELGVSLHKETNWENIRQTIILAGRKNWKLSFIQFEASVPEDKPKWFCYNIKKEVEQQQAGYNKYKNLLEKEIFCQPKYIYMGTDGHAYMCERGTRSKSERFRAGFGLTYGEPEIKYYRCVVEKDCLSCIINEQNIKTCAVE